MESFVNYCIHDIVCEDRKLRFTSLQQSIDSRLLIFLVLVVGWLVSGVMIMTHVDTSFLLSYSGQRLLTSSHSPASL